MILDNEVPYQRKIVVKPVAGSYNSFSIDEKQKRDWSGNIYLACVVGVLTIAFFT
ncbi:hypothetical protein J7E51_27850 [Priestia megaterium]|nr:hypothetical protein [Priestia megaterium]